jgi:acetolactate synthase-1/2/3 large subunit
LLSIPVATNYGGKGCFPEDSPLYIGTPGGYGRPVTGEIIREADVVFFVGTRASPHMTEEFNAPVPGACKIIQLDIDPVTIGRNYKADVALVGDAKATLQDLLDVLKKMIAKPSPKGERIKEIAKRIRAYESSVTVEGTDKFNSGAAPIWPQRIINEVSKFIGAKDIVVSDTGNMLSLTVLFLKLKGVGRNYLPVGGTLGASFATAIGASFGAAKDQRVIHMTGDTGMGYNLTDVETSVRYKNQHAPMVTIVNNNSSIATPAWPLTPVSYAKIFEDLGGYGVRVEKPGEIRDALKEAFDSGKPACVDCVSEPSARSRMGAVYIP